MDQVEGEAVVIVDDEDHADPVANRSVARTRPSVMPGSVNRWLASGTIWRSTSGQAFLSAQAAEGGVQQSWRPWTITPGMPRSFFAPANSWPGSSQHLCLK